MIIQSVEDNKSTPSLIVRVLSPLGVYPEKSILTDLFSYYADSDICFSIIPYDKFEVDNENYYSEMEWAHPNEIRLLASLLLSVDRYINFICIYPFAFTERLSVSGKLSLKDPVLLDQIKEFLIQPINSPDKQVSGFPRPQRNKYKNAKGISLPPANGGPNYDFRNEGFSYELQKRIYKSADKKDYLAIRGLSCLIKSFMLNAHHHFIEEAIYSLFIALEASFRMVLRELRNRGINSPTSSDAMDYIHDAFNDIHRFDKYFEEYYQGRIKSMHPESRFGIFPYAPLMIDDFYDLADDLLEVYAFLLTGYVNPRHKEKLKLSDNQ